MPITPETHAWRRRLPHLQRLDRQYYITFVTRDREILSPSQRTITLETILAGRERSYGLYSVVVMPDHVHVILAPYAHTTLPRIMKFIKSASSRKIGQGITWQEEYFDRIIRRDEDLRKRGEYVAANPARAGLVGNTDDYSWIWREWVEGRRERG